MRDYGLVRLRVLEMARQGWVRPGELARELGVGEEDVYALLDELTEKGYLYRDGPLAIAREGRA